MGNDQFGTVQLEMTDDGITTHRGNHAVGVESGLLCQQALHHNRNSREPVGILRSEQGRFEAQTARIDQRILSAMTDKEAVHPHIQRQVRMPFVGMVEHHWRMMKRRQIEVTQIDIIARVLVGQFNPFLQYLRARHPA